MELQKPTLVYLSQILNNEGQISGLLPNPREIDKDNFDKLKKQIQNFPELLDYRALLVMPYKQNQFIAIGGNMRLRALKELGYETAPCFILPEDTDPDTLNAYQILDNVPFGKWDLTKLLEGWDTSQLQEFAVDVPVPQDSLNLPDFFDEGDDEGKVKILITLPPDLQELKDEIKDYIKNQLTTQGYTSCKVK